MAQGGFKLKVGFVTGDDVTHTLAKEVQSGWLSGTNQ